MWAQVPSKEQVSSVTEELQSRSTLPEHLKKVLSSLPKDTHPMTQLSIAILTLQVSHCCQRYGRDLIPHSPLTPQSNSRHVSCSNSSWAVSTQHTCKYKDPDIALHARIAMLLQSMAMLQATGISSHNTGHAALCMRS